MTEPLRTLLQELAEDHPAVPVDPTLYARGRRAHRRGIALRLGATAAVVGVLAGLSVPLVGSPDGAAPPATSDVQPAMPDRLYAVPERLASSHEDGYRWHEAVRADGLAIGPTAAILPVNGGAVMAVSAVDGGYRGLDLPGFDESSYFRFEDLAVALSPDGTRLAWTWNPHVVSDTTVEGPVETGIRIADLETGEVTDVEIPSEYGVFAHGFGWSPDGRYLAYELQTVTSPNGEVRGSRNYQVGRLDTTTGEVVVTGLTGTDSAPAVSQDGTVAVSGGGYNGVWSAEADRPPRTYDGPFDSVAWSPGGLRTALASANGQLAIGDRRGIIRQSGQPAQDDGRVRVLGWTHESAFVLLDESASSLMLVSADLEDRRVLVRADGVADLYQLSVATELLFGPTRDAAAPDWPTDWPRAVLWGGLGLGALLAGLALIVGLRRRAAR